VEIGRFFQNTADPAMGVELPPWQDFCGKGGEETSSEQGARQAAMGDMGASPENGRSEIRGDAQAGTVILPPTWPQAPDEAMDGLPGKAMGSGTSLGEGPGDLMVCGITIKDMAPAA